MMNPFLSVSDSSGIKGGAGHSLSPSLSRIENKFSTQRQFSSQRLNIIATKIREACSCKHLSVRFFTQPSPATGPSLKLVHKYVLHFWKFASRFFLMKGVYGHITLNTPVLVRSLKLSKVETC